MLIRNLAGIFTCCGFAESGGRHPTVPQADFIRGPVDIFSDDSTGMIVEIGRALTVPSGCKVIDGADKVALPGFVDSHTHSIFSGSRAGEFFRRWAGQSYLEIAETGGGIVATQRWTAEANEEQLTEQLVERLRAMTAGGTVVVEIKSGYGRNAAEELRLLHIIKTAARRVPEMRVIPTFLGLHALPSGVTGCDYTNEMISALSTVKEHDLAVFADSFPEKGFFSLEEAMRFSRAAKDSGLRFKVHADELSDLGTSRAFTELGATSIDHLQHISDDAIAALAVSETTATLLPATSFYLGLPYADARRLIDAGARLALATDFNPGTAPSLDVRFTALLAASQLKMSAAEILCAVTYNGAYSLGVANEFGTLAPSKRCRATLFAGGSLATLEPQELLEEIISDGATSLTQVI